MKPIEQAFKLAKAGLRLANEWRDTLSYAAGAALAALTALEGYPKALPLFAIPVALRELTRAAMWEFGPQIKHAGFSAPRINTIKNFGAATFMAGVSGLMLVGGMTVVIGPAVFGPDALARNFLLGLSTGFFFTTGVATYCLGGRINDIPDLYFDKETGMWDWPRKRDGGGTTQTQKFKDGFAKLGKRLTGLLPTPQPKPATVAIPAQMRPALD